MFFLFKTRQNVSLIHIKYHLKQMIQSPTKYGVMLIVKLKAVVASPNLESTAPKSMCIID